MKYKSNMTSGVQPKNKSFFFVVSYIGIWHQFTKPEIRMGIKFSYMYGHRNLHRFVGWVSLYRDVDCSKLNGMLTSTVFYIVEIGWKIGLKFDVRKAIPRKAEGVLFHFHSVYAVVFMVHAFLPDELQRSRSRRWRTRIDAFRFGSNPSEARLLSLCGRQIGTYLPGRGFAWEGYNAELSIGHSFEVNVWAKRGTRMGSQYVIGIECSTHFNQRFLKQYLVYPSSF